jgi:CBS domain-containing protein
MRRVLGSVMGMIIKHNYLKKEHVITVLEMATVQEALKILSETGFRCVPVVGENGEYKGNIYKVHLLESILEDHQNEKKKIRPLIKDQETYITEETSFYTVLLSIKWFPFLPVIDTERKLMGIVTHSKVMSLLEDSFGLRTGGYSLTIGTSEYKGALLKLAGIVSKYGNIQGLLTLDDGNTFIRRIILTISDIDEKMVKKLIKECESHGFRVVFLEKLQRA